MYSVVAGVVVLEKIEIGHRNNLQVEVLSGLGEVTRVVAHPSDRIVAGVDVVAQGG